MSNDLLATVLPLVGVVLGAAGAFAGQFIATRETKKQARTAMLVAQRAERKEAILAFLEVCQRVERAAERRFQEGDRYIEGSAELTHQMWFHQKVLDLVSSPQVRESALRFSQRLNDVTYGRIAKGRDFWDFVNERRQPFIDAARVELGVSAS